MEKAGEKTVASSSQKFEIDKLNEAMEQQKAQIDRLRWLLDNIGTGNLSLSLHFLRISMDAEDFTFFSIFLTVSSEKLFRDLEVSSRRINCSGCLPVQDTFHP